VCKGCGQSRTSFPAFAPAIPTVGEAGLILVEFVGEDPQTQFGAVTGQRYPFGEAAERFVDCRDFPTLRDVIEKHDET